MTTRKHGTYARYHQGPDQHNQPGGCRCRPCRNANTTYARRRRRRIAYGQWPHLTDPTPARNHIATLHKAGTTLKTIAETTGLSTQTIWHIHSGRRKAITPHAAAAILAIQPPRTQTGIRRRAQALARLGYTYPHQAQLLGIPHHTYKSIITGNTKTWPAHKTNAQTALFDRLAWAPLPTGWIAERCRRDAARKGFPPPAAWDDDTIDDPAAVPDLGAPQDNDIDDHAAPHGITTTNLTRAQKKVAFAQLDAAGLTANQIAAQLGLSQRSIQRRRAAAGKAAA